MFSRIGEPLYRIRSCAGMRTTNVAYGGDDRRTLYITESEQGVILRVRLDTSQPVRDDSHTADQFHPRRHP